MYRPKLSRDAAETQTDPNSERTLNGSRMDPERIPDEPRTDLCEHIGLGWMLRPEASIGIWMLYAAASATSAAASTVSIYAIVIGGRFAPPYKYMVKYITQKQQQKQQLEGQGRVGDR